MKRAVELFSGTDSVGRVLRAHGFEVVSVDNGSEWKKGDPWGQPTHRMDVRDFYRTTSGRFLFGWASVPCHKFSVSVIGKNWTHDHQPKNDATREALDLLRQTISYLEANCDFFLIENPSGKMIRIIERDYPHLAIYRTAWCRYREPGEMDAKKPSDLFGRMPPGFRVEPMCRNGSPCHKAAPRKSRTGTQGKELKDKGVIPARLVSAIATAITPHAIAHLEARNDPPSPQDEPLRTGEGLRCPPTGNHQDDHQRVRQELPARYPGSQVRLWDFDTPRNHGVKVDAVPTPQAPQRVRPAPTVGGT